LGGGVHPAVQVGEPDSPDRRYQGEEGPADQADARQRVGNHCPAHDDSSAANRATLVAPTKPSSASESRMGSVVVCLLYAASIAMPPTRTAISTSMAIIRSSMVGPMTTRVSASNAATASI